MVGFGYKRREILVDPQLQVGLAINLLGWLYFYIVLFVLLANAAPIYGVLIAESTDASYIESVQRLQWFTQISILPLALTAVCVTVHSLLFTHRIAGPLYRIKATLRDMAQHRYAAHGVKLRNKDYFKDVATEISTVLDGLREDAARQRRMNTETLEGARRLVEAMEAGDASKSDLLGLAHLTLDRAERLDRHLLPAEPEPMSADAPHPEVEIAVAAPRAPGNAPAPQPATATGRSFPTK